MNSSTHSNLVRACARLEAIYSHLLPPTASEVYVSATGGEAVTLDKKALRQWIDQHNLELRDRVFATLQEPLFSLDGRYYNLPKEEQRKILLARSKRLAELGYTRYILDTENLHAWWAIAECISYSDLALGVRFSGAQVGLFVGSLLNLGSEAQQKKYLDDALSFRLTGCFALTELGHGSNARAVETTATYDAATQEFIVDTPNDLAQKFYIGGAVTAHMAVVIARLLLGNRDEGVHAFLVPLRDRTTGEPLQGVCIADVGHKMGINGVDNGRLWFDHVRIPRENLLSKFGEVTPDGRYVSSLATPDERFAANIGALSAGRVGIVSSSTAIAKIALATAIRYALTRRQFGGPPEQRLIDYPVHQRRLLPFLASAYVYNAVAHEIADQFIGVRKRLAAGGSVAKLMKNVHVLSAGLKAVSSWNMAATLQSCRECCGGQGFSTANRIGTLKNDGEAWLTFEGDNYVLIQQVSRELLKAYQQGKTSDLVFLGELARRRAEVLALVGASSSPSDYVRSEQFQRYVLQEREAVLLQKAANRMDAALATFPDPMQAWNENCDVLVAVAKADMERRCFEIFCDRIAQCKHKGNAAALVLLRQLFALSLIDADKTFASRGHAFWGLPDDDVVEKEITALCHEVAPLSRDLVDAWAIPPPLLGAIAGDWEAYYHYTNRERVF